MAERAAVQVQNVAVGYGERIVLRNVSFEIREGEIVALLGGSGCGKSTMLKAVIGLLSSWAASATKRASRRLMSPTCSSSPLVASTRRCISCGTPRMSMGLRSSARRSSSSPARLFKGLSAFQSTKRSTKSITGARMRMGAADVSAENKMARLRSVRSWPAAT